jgi:hypothetical protein
MYRTSNEEMQMVREIAADYRAVFQDIIGTALALIHENRVDDAVAFLIASNRKVQGKRVDIQSLN